MSFRVLLIEDDVRLAGMVADYLREAGFHPTIAHRASEGERRLSRETFDAVVLDLMLPDADGLDVCRRIRADSSIPLLMLTARGDPFDRVVGLELGADDYLPKPFEPRELLAQILKVRMCCVSGGWRSTAHRGRCVSTVRKR
jgi:two-component system phosphate regulon response regulator OmpR